MCMLVMTPACLLETSMLDALICTPLRPHPLSTTNPRSQQARTGYMTGDRSVVCDHHLASNVDDLVKRDVARVLHVLHLLTVPRGLLESLEDQCGRGGNNLHAGHTVLADELARHTHTLVVLGRLGDVITHLLGGLLKHSSTPLLCQSRATVCVCSQSTGTAAPELEYSPDTYASIPIIHAA